MSILKPGESFGASLATMGLVYGIFQIMSPPLANVKASAPHNSTVNSVTRQAGWTAVSACAALSFLGKDPNIFIFGAGMASALMWYYNHANMQHPGTGQVTFPPSGGAQPGGVTGS
jgi:hypothetical protein